MPAPRIARTIPKPIRQKREGDDPQHVRNVKQLPCCVTGRRDGVDAHHLLKVGDQLPKGMSRKNEDRWCIPLHRSIHDELHDRAGDEEAYLASLGIDGRSLARALWANRGDIEGMERVVFRARQMVRR